jgi:uridine kinase
MKAIQDKIQQIQDANKDKVCVVGIYGVGGIGKTTTCKTLSNELLQEFEGKVSHVELDSESPKELLKRAVKDLTNTSQELLQQLNEGEVIA